MERFLYIFNPDHDLALANRDVNYMAPVAARRLSDDLALLPVWYGRRTDYVLAASTFNTPYLDKLKTIFPDLPTLLTEPEVMDNSCLIPSPWGWNPAMRKRLHLLGINECSLPGWNQLQRMYECSHRSLAVKTLPALKLTNECCGSSFYFSDVDSIKKFVEKQEACVLKAPISGSGKGLNWCKGSFTTHIHNWCINILKQQHGVVGEPLYDKVVDFAMQFYADGSGKVRFCGYSLFYTAGSGAYEGNMLAGNEEIERKLTAYVSADSLSLLQSELTAKLAVALSDSYVGYLGVDMMICRFSDSYAIHPCVEINLRMNMGMVARLFYDRFVHPDKKGDFRIEYHTSHKELMDTHLYREREYPLLVQDGKIQKGYLSLVPVTPQSLYNAFILIKD